MIRKLFSSQLRINMVSGVAVTLVNIAVLAISYPVYLHFLGYEKYGLWLVLATVLSFAQLGNLGIGQAAMKLVAEEYGRGNIEGIQRYVTTALFLLCLSGTVALTIILKFKSLIISAFNLSDSNAKVVLWLLPFIGLLSVYVFVVQTLNATLSGLGRIDQANYIKSAGRIVAVATASSMLYFGHGIESLLLGNTLSNLFIHIVSLIFIRRIAYIPFLRIGSLNAQCCKRLLRFGGGVFGGSLIGIFFGPFNKLLISRYIGVSSIPVFEIAFRGSLQIRSLGEASLRALIPEISRLYGEGTTSTKRRIQMLYRRTMKLIFLFGGPVYGVLAVLSPLALKIWLGDKFTETLPVIFQIILAGTFLSLLCVPSYYNLMGFGKVRHCFLSQLIQGIVNACVVGLSVLFTGTVSIHMVAFAVFLSMGATSFYVIWQHRRVMQKIMLDPSNDCMVPL